MTRDVYAHRQFAVSGGALWPRGQYVRRAIKEAKQRSQRLVIG
jgi:hypothetical protein